MIVEVGTDEAFPPVHHGDQSARYAGQSADQVLERFATLRQANLEAVRPLLTDASVPSIAGASTRHWARSPCASCCPHGPSMT